MIDLYTPEIESTGFEVLKENSLGESISSKFDELLREFFDEIGAEKLNDIHLESMLTNAVRYESSAYRIIKFIETKEQD